METPIAFIPPIVMEEFLDDCLLDNGLITDEGFEMTFKYSFLGPPLTKQGALDSKALLSDEDGDVDGKDLAEDEDEEVCLEELPEAGLAILN